MNRRLNLIGIILTLVLIGCNEKQQDYQGTSIDFGNSEYYEKFLWVEDDTTQLRKRLKFEFNSFAQKNDSKIELQLVDDNGELIKEKIQLFVDGKLQKNNSFELLSKEQVGKKEIGIKILPGSKEGYTTGFFKISNHSLDVVNNNDLNISQEKRIFGWEAQYDERMNPLKKGLLWLLGVILFTLIFWFLILRNSVFPKFKAGKVQVLSPYFGGIRLSKNTRLVVLTNKTEKQSSLNKLFKGRILYEVNSIYENEIVLRPGTRDRVKIKLPIGCKITPPVTNIEKYSKYIIETNNEKIEIQYS